MSATSCGATDVKMPTTVAMHIRFSRPKHKAQCKVQSVHQWCMREYGVQEAVRQSDTNFQSDSDVVDLTEVFFSEDVHIEPLQDSNTPGTTTGDKDCETHSDTEDLAPWVHGTEEDTGSQTNKTQEGNTHRTAMDQTDVQCKEEMEDLTELFFRGKDVPNKQQEDGNTPRTTTGDKDCDTESEREIEDITELFFGKDFPNKRLQETCSNTPGTTTGDKDCETDSDTEDLTAWVDGTEEDGHNNKAQDSETYGTAMDQTGGRSESDTEDLTSWISGTEEDDHNNEAQEAIPGDDKENTPRDDNTETDAADISEDDAEDLSHAVFREASNQPATSQERAKKRPLGKTARKSTSTAAIRAIFTQNCCKNNCVKKFSYKEAASCRKAFWVDRNESQGREYILTAFRLGDCAVEGLYHPKFQLCGKTVCHKAWMKLSGISASRYYSYLKLYKLGQFNNSEHGRQGNIYPTPRSLHAEVWMEDFAAKKDSGKIVLPAFWTMNNVYQLYREDNKEEDVKPLGKTQFWKVWRANYSHVKIPGEEQLWK